MSTDTAPEEEAIEAYVGKLNGNVWGISLALVLAFVLFAATNFLVFKGGENVGQHLGILSQYFYGYSVTFVGSLIGAAWAMILGYVVARLGCGIYNFASRG
ncbi:MAG: tetrahydromethanopterin S-methyltransferase subunit B [Planctomycetota bacterium]|jgi:tetrahydromethanopterin S-methyltransferase subunit B